MYNSGSEEDYETDDEILIKRKFIDIDIPKDFNPNKVPSSGEEYLQHAIYEAKHCQTVITSNIDTSNFNNMCKISTLDDDLPKATTLFPTKAWQNKKVAEFAEFRDYIQSKLPRISENHDQTHLYCIKKVESEFPQFSIVSKLNAYVQLNLLELIISKLQCMKAGDTICDSMGVWIHCILSVIKIPMSPDLCSVLRTLARQCVIIRSKLPAVADFKQYNHLNFFICIIGIYFKQFDLADNSADF